MVIKQSRRLLSLQSRLILFWQSQDIEQQKRWRRYIVVNAIGNGFIWTTTLFFLISAKPEYTSEWAIILPNSSTNVSVNLEGIGQTSSLAESGGASSTSDPRANYEYIFLSQQVLDKAAKLVSISGKEFGKPKIKAIENTTIMEITVEGNSPAQAQLKATAYYRSMLSRLSELRKGLIEQREEPTKEVLRNAQKRLADAQEAVARYQLSSGLVSSDQVTQLYTNIEGLRLDRARTISSYSKYSAQLSTLEKTIGLNPKEASQAFLLLSDQSFQNSAKAYGEASAELKLLNQKFGPNNPKVLLQKSKLQSSEAAMRNRASTLLGKKYSSINLAKLSLNVVQNGRDELLKSLISDKTEGSGLQSQAHETTRQIEQLELRLRSLSQLQVKLESLKREEKVAEAVFASTLAKLDLGQANQFTAFPLIQIAVEPSLPEKPSSPRYSLILASSTMGSILVTVGLAILWVRKPWIYKLSHWISS